MSGKSEPVSRLKDNYNRRLNYLRISITDRCNLNCIYCAPNPYTAKLSHHAILRYEEILRFVNIASALGISKVRITGGEPLVRKGVYQFLSQLSKHQSITDLSLTTNGVCLNENVSRIFDSGVERMNISLDTLDPGKYRRITGVDAFFRVWEGILNAHAVGFRPIKINVVAMKGINDDEFEDFARLTFTYPYHIRFIEYMPIGKQVMAHSRQILTPEIKAIVRSVGRLIPVDHQQQDGPAENYKFEGALGKVGFISPISHHFCESCNRLRLTADGHLKTCLLSDTQYDMKTPLRSGSTDDEIARLLLEQVASKPHFHQLRQGGRSRIDCDMSAIGG